MDNALSMLKKYGPPALLGYAGSRVAAGFTASSGTIARIIVGAGLTGAGVFLGLKFSGS